MREKDFELRILVRNNRILKAMKAAGIPTVAELARRTGLSLQTAYLASTFKITPITKAKPEKASQWKDWAFAISSALHVEPEDLWPKYIRYLRSAGGRIYEMDAEEIRTIEAPKKTTVDRVALYGLLEKLPDRNREVLERLLKEGERPEEIGVGFGVNGQNISRSRVTQLAEISRRMFKGQKFRDRKLGGRSLIDEDYVSEVDEEREP